MRFSGSSCSLAAERFCAGVCYHNEDTCMVLVVAQGFILLQTFLFMYICIFIRQHVRMYIYICMYEYVSLNEHADTYLHTYIRTSKLFAVQVRPYGVELK